MIKNYFIIYLLGLILISCISEKKSLQRAQNKVIQSGTLSNLCAKYFPIKEEITKGDTIEGESTLYLSSHGKLGKPESNLPATYDNMPSEGRNYYGFLAKNHVIDTLTIIKRFYIHDTLKIESTAKLDAMNRLFNECTTDVKQLSKQYIDQRDKTDKVTKQRNIFAGLLAVSIVSFAICIILRIKGIL